MAVRRRPDVLQLSTRRPLVLSALLYGLVAGYLAYKKLAATRSARTSGSRRT